VLFVEASSPFQHVEDLQGGSVAWVDPTSASGYLHPRLQLASRGIDTRRLFREEQFFGSHAAVARAVLDGKADAGATFAEWPGDGQPVRRAGFLEIDPNAGVRCIEWTAAIPNDVIVGLGDIDPDLRDRFARALLSMSTVGAGRKVLEDLFHAQQFLWAPQNAFDPLRKLVHDARAHGLLPTI
jgi:ABC-type phosphate/phosphonate transport system substrate-binding protein